MPEPPTATPHVADDPRGVVFPLGGGGRSTSAFARTVLAEALDGVDEVGRRAVLAEANWHQGYLQHFRRVLEAGLTSAAAAVGIARAGLEAFTGGMRWIDPDTAAELSLPEACTDEALDTARARRRPAVLELRGHGERVRELSLPYRGRMLAGAELAAQLDAWVDRGIVEPGVAQAVRAVAAHPDRLALPGHAVIALGAGAEIGPTPTLLRWGARVIGIDLPRPEIWRRVLDQADQAAGPLVVPVRPEDSPAPDRAGADLLTDLPALAVWLDDLVARSGSDPLRPVLGNYLYADGAENVRVSAAGDALAAALRRRHPDLVQAFLATPTDVFAVPATAVAASVAAYSSGASRWTARGLRTLSGGRLLRRAYLPGADPGVSDSLVAQQGPNYALAKRVQRWRATVERAEGRRVSMNVAPPTRTRSVVKNRALAAAYAGAHRFGVEVFEPSTTRVLMAALLVHDLFTEPVSVDHPWQAEALQAAHGGLWTGPFEPRSALGLAAVLGFGASRQ